MGGNETTTHHTREVLLKQIKERPGITFSKLMSLLDLNEGTLRYHLNYLEREERIRSKKEGVNRIFFTSVSSPSTRPGIEDLRIDQKRVLNIIQRYPGIRSNDILGSTDLSRKVLITILNRLKRDHLIWEVENGNGIGYELITRERLLEEMLLDVVESFLRGKIDQSNFIRLKEWIEEEKRIEKYR